jgi:hypothetical protein
LTNTEEEASKSLKANITDPDSRIMKTGKGYLQGYNAQAVASEDQRDGKIIPLPLTPVSTMEYNLLTPEGRKQYKKRSATIEPVFGHIKEILDFDRFMRRGLEACDCEWKMICTSHNLLKLWRYGIDKVRKKTDQATAIEIKSGQRIYAVAV